MPSDADDGMVRSEREIVVVDGMEEVRELVTVVDVGGLGTSTRD